MLVTRAVTRQLTGRFIAHEVTRTLFRPIFSSLPLRFFTTENSPDHDYKQEFRVRSNYRVHSKPYDVRSKWLPLKQ